MKIRIPIILLLAFSIFPSDVEGLREIQIGDKIPAGPELKFLDGSGKTVLLYLKSEDPKSILFFRQYARSINARNKINFFLVDLNSGTDERIRRIFDNLAGEKKIINDPDRKIYGKLGIIVLPTILYINEDLTLASAITGYRSNLGMFFRAHLKSLERGEMPGDIYREFSQKQASRKTGSMKDRAFALLLDKNFALAASEYKKALEEDPDDDEAALGHGFSLLVQGKSAEALAFFESGVNSSGSKRLNLGMYLARSITDPSDENLSNLSRYALVEPTFFPAIHEAGVILEKNGKPGPAAKIFSRGYSVLLRAYSRHK